MFWWYIILLFTITHSAGNPLAHYGAEGEVLQPRQLRRKDDVAQTLSSLSHLDADAVLAY